MQEYEYERARRWRRENRYTMAEISRLTGFSVSSIRDFERGFVKGDKSRPIDRGAAQRYRMCLAAIAHDLASWNYGNA